MEDGALGLLVQDLDAGFERMVDEHQHRLYAFALGLTGRRQDAEEVAQDAFVRAYRALRGYPADRIQSLRLRPWLHRIALNVQRNRVRGRRLEVVPLPERDEVADGAPQPAEVAERRESSEELRAALDRLPQRYREAVVLRHVQGLPYAEAATVLEQPVGTVKSDVHRGLAMLRAWLERQCEVETA
jgi:RNA polymerase sigma-70 factor (ECF subfamily)